MNPVLVEILRTRQSLAADGKTTVAVHSTISDEEGDLLTRLIAGRKPKVSLEIGLAYGVSALFICEAMRQASNNPHHIVIDPAQHASEHWQGVGLANLRRAGYGDFIEFIERPSQIALPELITASRKIDFAFIDGEHTFDHVLVDFFFVDQLLNVGGVVVLDDASWPSIRRVVRFIAANRNYAVVGHAGCDDSEKSRRYRKDSPDEMEFDRRYGLKGECIAFEKKGDDNRAFNHFVDFQALPES